jgi:hypothetical protein
MSHSRHRTLAFGLATGVALVVAGASGCGGAGDTSSGASSSAPDTAIRAPQSNEDAKSVASDAAAMRMAVAEMTDFLGRGLMRNMGLPGVGNPLGGLNGGLGALTFSGSATCNATVGLTPGQFSVTESCTLPSGRTLSGSFIVSLGGGCGLGSLSVTVEVKIGPAPGHNDSLEVKGAIALTLQAGQLYALSQLSVSATGLGHTLVDTISDCLVIDWADGVFAYQGSLAHAVDSTVLFAASATNVQHAWCELLPYTGSFAVDPYQRQYTVAFSQPDPATEEIDVDANGATSTSRVPVVGLPGCKAPAPPLVFDLATCGGCGTPPPATDGGAPPPPPPPTNDAGTPPPGTGSDAGCATPKLP